MLTKRSDYLLEMSPSVVWPENVWMGVSVERQDYVYRIDHLRETGAAVKFVSLEPLLGPLHKLDLRGIDWVIVGGESGPGCPTDGGRLGLRNQGTMRKRPSSLLLQAVGRLQQEEGGPAASRSHVGRTPQGFLHPLWPFELAAEK